MTLCLRAWTPTDAAALYEAVSVSPDLTTQFGPSTPHSLAEAESVIAQRLSSNDGRRNFAITIDDRPVGNVGVSNIDRVNDIGWIYYWLDVHARGRGLAARAAATLAQYCFEPLGLFRLELGHRVNNPASCAVATRAGFAVEGVERQKLRYGDQRFDTETHARLASDPAPALELISLAL